MTTQVTQTELDMLMEEGFERLRERHLTDGMSEDIMSNYYKKFIKSTWFSGIPLKLKRESDGDETVYRVNNSYDLLSYSYMRFNLPKINIKPEYKNKVQISWCHNVGTNIIKMATFMENDVTYQKWDNVWADIYYQFYQNGGAGQRKNHGVGVGNVMCVEGWNEMLPAYTINVDQPWFYSEEPALSFPIFYKNSLTRAEHRYKLNNKIYDLLRVQIKTPSGWKNVAKKHYNNYLNIKDKEIKPELWGYYVSITEREKEYMYSCETNRVLYTRDIEICDAPNPNSFNTTSDVPLQSTNPCLAFFWVAENVIARKYNNLSNYTTNSDNLYSGWDPIKTTTLKYKTSCRLQDMASDHFSIAQARKHFPSAPCESGYHAYSFATNSTSYDADVGIIFNNTLNAHLLCEIDNNNIFSNSVTDDSDATDAPDDDDDLKSITSTNSSIKLIDVTPKFINRVRLLVVRKFSIDREIEKIPDAEKPYRYRFTIQ